MTLVRDAPTVASKDSMAEKGPAPLTVGAALDGRGAGGERLAAIDSRLRQHSPGRRGGRVGGERQQGTSTWPATPLRRRRPSLETTGVFQAAPGGGTDVFVAKIAYQAAATITGDHVGPVTVNACSLPAPGS